MMPRGFMNWRWKGIVQFALVDEKKADEQFVDLLALLNCCREGLFLKSIDPIILKIIRQEFLNIFDYNKLETENQIATESASQKRALSEEKEAV